MSGSQGYIPDDIRPKIPSLSATRNDPNPTVWIKLSTPDGCRAWYVIEYDGTDTCFGHVVGDSEEPAYFQLSDLARDAVERDPSFRPMPLADVLKGGCRPLSRRARAYASRSILKARVTARRKRGSGES